MMSETRGWTPRERLLTALCTVSMGFSVAAYLDLGGSADAAPAGVGASVSSGEIANRTIRSADIRPDAIGAREIGANLYLRYGEVFVDPLGEAAGRIACDPGDRIISGGVNANRGLETLTSMPERNYTRARLDSWWYEFVNQVQASQYVLFAGICLRR